MAGLATMHFGKAHMATLIDQESHPYRVRERLKRNVLEVLAGCTSVEPEPETLALVGGRVRT